MISSDMRVALDRYEELTERALQHRPRPELVVWPETVFPSAPDDETELLSRELRQKVDDWKVVLVTGAYGNDTSAKHLVHNSAFLLDPTSGSVKYQSYAKNELLLFGESLPLGEWFPSLYGYFPTMTHFAPGTAPGRFQINGHPFGVTICYEAVLPELYRRAASGTSAVLNLTNDAWFGPTSEPRFHAALTVFRAVENRVPLARVANSGLSFFVDDRGNAREITGAFEQGIAHARIALASPASRTFYAKHGEWFAAVCLAWLLLLTALTFKTTVETRAHDKLSD
jgi:apolipoprotein N-acyltransferase